MSNCPETLAQAAAETTGLTCHTGPAEIFDVATEQALR